MTSYTTKEKLVGLLAVVVGYGIWATLLIYNAVQADYLTVGLVVVMLLLNILVHVNNKIHFEKRDG